MAKRLKSVALFLLLIVFGCMVMACTPKQSGHGGAEGEIIPIEEAYNNNLLTTSDLQTIAYYMGCSKSVDIIPKSKNPTVLSDETELTIKLVYLKDLQKEYPQATINDVAINNYYGTYGSCIAVRLSNSIVHCDYLFEDEKDIGGVVFYNYCDAFVSIILI